MIVSGKIIRLALLIGISSLIGCGGSGGENTAAAPIRSADEPNRVTVTNGFVATRAIERDGSGALVADTTYRVDTAANRIFVSGENFSAGTTYESTLIYDGSGDLVSDRYEVSDGFSGSNVYEHDERGLLRQRTISTRTVDDAGLPLNFVDVETFEYDTRNRLLSRETVAGEEETQILGSTDYFYGSGPMPTSALEVFQDGDFVDEVVRDMFIYDADGRLIRLQGDNQDDGSIDFELAYEYDASGNMTRRVETDAAGAVATTLEYTYEAVDEPVFNRWIRIFRYFI